MSDTKEVKQEDVKVNVDSEEDSKEQNDVYDSKEIKDKQSQNSDRRHSLLVSKLKTLGQQKEDNTNEDFYILDKFPADIQFAEQHAKSKKVRKPMDFKDKENEEEIKICECCGFKISDEEIPLSENYMNLSFLGPGVPLYFSFVIGCIYMLLVGFLVFGIANIYFNLQGNDCQKKYIENECQSTFISKMSVANKKNDTQQLEIQSIINLITVFILVLSLHVFRRENRKKEKRYDAALVSPSDFTAQLQQLPPDVTKEKIMDLLKVWWAEQPLSDKEKALDFETDIVKKIVIAYDLSDYYKFVGEKNRLSLKIKKIMYFLKKKKRYPKDIDEEKVIEMKKEENKLRDQIDLLGDKVEQQDKSIKPSSVAFISFGTQSILDSFADSQDYSWLQLIVYSMQLCCGTKPKDVLLMENKVIKADRAPEPSDVKWENCGISNTKKNIRRFTTLLVTLGLLLGCFWIIYGVNKLQYEEMKKLAKNNDSYSNRAQQMGLSILASFFIVFINAVLTMSIKKFASNEYRSTQTHVNISIGSKLSVAQFTNTAILTLVANFWISEKDVWSANGLITDIFYISLIQSIFIPAANIFNIWELLRIYKRRSIRKAVDEDADGCLITQGEANYWFEGQQLELANSYSHLLKMMWMTAAYASLLPILFIITCLALIITYWTDKKLLLQRYTRPNLLSQDLNHSMLEKLEYFPLAMAIGNVFFQYQLSQEGNILIFDVVAILISSLNFIIPSSYINRKLCSADVDDEEEQTIYDKAKLKFHMDYDRCNPITAKKALKQYIQDLKDYGDESQKQQAQQMEDQNIATSQVQKNIVGQFGRGFIPNGMLAQQFQPVQQPRYNPFNRQYNQQMLARQYGQPQYQQQRFYNPQQQQQNNINYSMAPPQNQNRPIQYQQNRPMATMQQQPTGAQTIYNSQNQQQQNRPQQNSYSNQPLPPIAQQQNNMYPQQSIAPVNPQQPVYNNQNNTIQQNQAHPPPYSPPHSIQQGQPPPPLNPMLSQQQQPLNPMMQSPPQQTFAQPPIQQQQWQQQGFPQMVRPQIPQQQQQYPQQQYIPQQQQLYQQQQQYRPQ